jgi:hypothetical protein
MTYSNFLPLGKNNKNMTQGNLREIFREILDF